MVHDRTISVNICFLTTNILARIFKRLLCQSIKPTHPAMTAQNASTTPIGLQNHFIVWDYLVFAGLLLMSSAIGLFYGCRGSRQSSNAEFLMAGRDMAVLPVALSLLASFMSAITLLSIPSEMLFFGTQYWVICVAYVFVILTSAFVFVPIFYRLRITSVFEYMEKRFSKGVRTYTCIVYIIQTVLYQSLVLYAPCLALSVVTGLNKWIAVAALGSVCTFYTTIGGMKAVIWTDVMQLGLMFAGMIGIVVKGSYDHGGLYQLWSDMSSNDRIEFLNLDPNPLVRHTLSSIVIGGYFTWVAIYGVNQTQIQRALCTSTLWKGQLAMLLNIPGLIALMTICCLCGFVLFAEYKTCDPIQMNAISDKDQLLPFYVMDKMFYPAFPGFFTACIFSGALSTISSGLNSLAAVFAHDLLFQFCIKEMDENNRSKVSKLISIVFGILTMLLTLMAANLGGLLQAAIGIFGMIGGPVLGIFLLGIFYPCANYKGAYVGLTLGLLLTLWVGIGAQVYKPPIIGHIPPPITTSNCSHRKWLNDGSSSTLVPDLLNIATTSATNYSYSGLGHEITYASGNSTSGDTNSTSQLSDDTMFGYLNIYQLSYIWYSAFGVFVSSISGLLVSLLTGPNRPTDVDPMLLNPILSTISKCLPSRCNLRAIPDEYDNESFEIEDKLSRLSKRLKDMSFDNYNVLEVFPDTLHSEKNGHINHFNCHHCTKL